MKIVPYQTKRYIKKIPNILTILRIFLAILTIVFLFLGNNQDVALYTFSINSYISWISPFWFSAGVIFAVASLTDFLDGYISRKYDAVSDFGKIWDPLVDKILTTSVYISFAVVNVIPFYLVLLFLLRDLIVDGYRMFATTKKIVVQANIYGKIKTVVQLCSILFIFFVFKFDNNLLFANFAEYYLIQNLLTFIALFSSIGSGIIYYYQINLALKKANV